jgi:glycosyltransferase involved in cell wall biosynthesis
VIGYVGAIAEWFDMSLLVQVAQLAPQWDFVLVGSTAGSGTTIAHDLGNIQFLGEIAYVDVPEMITSFDVCLIPFKISALTLATNPVKLYEYLASGRPVVATPLPELNLPKNCDVYTAASAVDFVEAIRIALMSADNPDRIVARKNWAKGHDWSQRGAQFVSCITEDSHSQLPLRICSA